MKAPILAVLLTLSTVATARAEIKTWIGDISSGSFTNSITVSSNQMFLFHSLVEHVIGGITGSSITVIGPGGTCKMSTDYQNLLPAKSYLAGPLQVNFSTGERCLITYEIVEKNPPAVPNTGVVIPTDATGPVNIILESSADMVNWTPSLPGTYGANTTNRFFRVRAVAQ